MNERSFQSERPESFLIRLMCRLICAYLTGCFTQEQSDKSGQPPRHLAVRFCSLEGRRNFADVPHMRKAAASRQRRQKFTCGGGAPPLFPPSCGLSRRCKARGGYYRGDLIKAQHFDDFAAVSAARTPPPCISTPTYCICQGPSLIA